MRLRDMGGASGNRNARASWGTATAILAFRPGRRRQPTGRPIPGGELAARDPRRVRGRVCARRGIRRRPVAGPARLHAGLRAGVVRAPRPGPLRTCRGNRGLRALDPASRYVRSGPRISGPPGAETLEPTNAEQASAVSATIGVTGRADSEAATALEEGSAKSRSTRRAVDENRVRRTDAGRFLDRPPAGALACPVSRARVSRWPAGLYPTDSTGAPECLPSPVHSAAGSRASVASRGRRGAASLAVPGATSHAPPLADSGSRARNAGPHSRARSRQPTARYTRPSTIRGDGVPYRKSGGSADHGAGDDPDDRHGRRSIPVPPPVVATVR